MHLFEATNLKFCGDPDAWKTWPRARRSPFPIPEKGVAVGCRCRGFLSVASTKLILQIGNVPEIRIMNGYEHNTYIYIYIYRYTIYIYVNGIWGIPSLQRSCDWLVAQSGPSASTGATTPAVQIAALSHDSARLNLCRVGSLVLHQCGRSRRSALFLLELRNLDKIWPPLSTFPTLT